MIKTRTILKSVIRKGLPIKWAIDLGCGKDNVFPPIIKEVDPGMKIIGVDGFFPYLSKGKGYDSYLIQADILDLPFHLFSFDLILCFNVIEHLEVTNANRLLDSFDSSSAKMVVIIVNNGDIPGSLRDGNKYMQHLSVWYKDNFVERGYKVLGIEGVKWFGFKYLSLLFQPVAYFFPTVANSLLCYKTKYVML